MLWGLEGPSRLFYLRKIETRRHCDKRLLFLALLNFGNDDLELTMSSLRPDAATYFFSELVQIPPLCVMFVPC